MGKKFIILIKGNTGGNSLVAGISQKSPCIHSKEKESIVKNCQIQKAQNHPVTFLPPYCSPSVSPLKVSEIIKDARRGMEGEDGERTWRKNLNSNHLSLVKLPTYSRL